MKTYIVYVNGDEVKVDGKTAYIKAANQNAAEKKAKAKYPDKHVDVAYTEI